MSGCAVLIITHNSQDEIGPCLDATALVAADVLVIDNASLDKTRDEVEKRGIRLIANRTNVGFAAAVNQGFSLLKTECLLLLNPDAVLKAGLREMVARCERPGVGIVGGALVDSRGRLQTGFTVRRFPTPAALAFEVLGWNRLFPWNPVNWTYRCFGMDLRKAREVEQPAGAFLAIRRPAWLKVGGFDEAFFPVWFEDVDFCKRVREAGYSVWFEPLAVAEHVGGHSVGKISMEKKRLYWYGSLLRYASKHFTRQGRRVVCVAVIFGSILRLIGSLFSERNRASGAAYSRIARLAGRYFSGARPAGVEVLS